MIGQPGFHRWRHPERLMHAAEVILGLRVSRSSFDGRSVLALQAGHCRPLANGAGAVLLLGRVWFRGVTGQVTPSEVFSGPRD